MQQFFTNVQDQPYDFLNPQGSGAISPAVGGGGDQSIQIGSGDQSLNADLTGFWIGNRALAAAPFRVPLNGHAVLSLYDKNDTLLADENGLTSDNFLFGEQDKEDDQVITGTSWQDVLGLGTTIEMIRNGLALVAMSFAGFHDDTNGRLEFQVTVNNVPYGAIFCLNRVAAASVVQTTAGYIIAPLIKGLNFVQIQARSSNSNSGTVKGTVIPSDVTYLLLGK